MKLENKLALIETWEGLITTWNRQKKEPQNYDLEQLDSSIKIVQKLIDDLQKEIEGGVC